jgi:hypothetical protein
VRREAQVLKDVGALHLTSVRVPAVLHHGTWNGHEVLVQEALTTGTAPHGGDGPLVAAMVEVAAAFGTGSQQLASSTYVHRLRARLADQPAHPAMRSLADLADQLVVARGQQVVVLGAWHGDWSPWNMLVRPGQALVWDWETFEDDVPAGFDRLHYQLQQDVVLRDVDPALALTRLLERAPAVLEPFGVPSASAPVVAVLYVMHLVAGLVETGEQHSRLSRFDAWLPRWLPEASRAVLDGVATS